jgi:hypothetical protein
MVRFSAHPVCGTKSHLRCRFVLKSNRISLGGRARAPLSAPLCGRVGRHDARRSQQDVVQDCVASTRCRVRPSVKPSPKSPDRTPIASAVEVGRAGRPDQRRLGGAWRNSRPHPPARAGGPRPPRNTTRLVRLSAAWRLPVAKCAAGPVPRVRLGPLDVATTSFTRCCWIVRLASAGPSFSPVLRRFFIACGGRIGVDVTRSRHEGPLSPFRPPANCDDHQASTPTLMWDALR